MALVSGYDSDSASESEGPKMGPPGLHLPPPSAASRAKRRPEKRQIRIDARELPSEGGKGNEEDGGAPKRAKVSDTGLHGLLGMLPAPMQTGPPTEEKQTAAPANKMGLAGDAESRLRMDAGPSSTATKARGNNDFRAMLGLKPSSLPAKPRASVPKPTPKQHSEESPRMPVATDFFALQTAAPSTSSAGAVSSISITSAPAIAGEEAEEEARARDAIAAEEEQRYRGWQQGPDGQWFPVTPEAHAAYKEYLTAQQNSSQADGQDDATERPADMQFGDINAIESVDANAARQAWLARPSTQADGAGLDRKYALAAASMAMPDQGAPLVDQEEEVAKMDKKTNMRARRAGQLSSLIAQAEENRERLEERWSKGKDGRNTAKAKYGF